MAKRKQAVAKADELAPTEATPPQIPETPPPVQEQRKAEQPPRPLMPDPFPFKTVNLGGYKIHFQHSKQAGEFQIRFGDGSRQDMPADSVRDLVKSHKVEVEAKDGEKKEVQLFHWNGDDRAWGMRINPEDPETSRQRAKNIYDEVVKLVAQEREAQQTPGR